jgi:hypothetical protein
VSAPRVSVVIAAYNAAWCLGRALDSVLAGTVLPAEVLVCDDGSTDGTAELVESRYGPPVRVLRLPHRNSPSARRAGLDAATGDWLAFMDADDVWDPPKLERQLAFLAGHPEVRWICSDGRLFADEGTLRESWLSDYFEPVETRVGDLFPVLVERCFPLMSSVMVERRAYHEVGGIDTAIAYSHDYDLWLRVTARYPGAMLAERLIGYFTHPGQMSRNFENRHLDDLGVMRRVAAGAMGRRPAEQRVAAARAAALEFDLAIACIRSGRRREGRERMWRAAGAGPPRRRAIALAAALAPAWLHPRLMRAGGLKRLVGGARRTPPVFRSGGGGS